MRLGFDTRGLAQFSIMLAFVIARTAYTVCRFARVVTPRWKRDACGCIFGGSEELATSGPVPERNHIDSIHGL